MAIEKAISNAPPPLYDEDDEIVDETTEFLIDALEEGRTTEDGLLMEEDDDGNIHITADDEEVNSELLEVPHEENLAEYMEEGELDDLGSELLENVKSDIRSTTEWREIYRDGLEQLGLSRPDDDTDFPFPDACKVVHPLLMESIIKYQSRARSQLLPPGGPVKTKITDDPEDLEEVEKAASRIRNTLNTIIDEDMVEYEFEHDKMLLYQGFFGSAFTKTYHDSMYGRPVSRNIRPQDFYVDYYANDLETAERYTEAVVVTKNDMKRAVENNLYMDVDISTSAEDDETSKIDDELDRLLGLQKPDDANDRIYNLYESHTDLDIGEGLNPYIVTIDKDKGRVLAIYRNWDEEDEDKRKKVYYVHWPLIPGFGFYGFGYLHIIGGLTDTATKVLRQLIDAGTFSNFPGGFKAHGLRVVGDQEPLQPGEWREINVIGSDLKRALMPMPYKEPSSTLVALLEFVVQAAQKFADNTEEIISESKNYGPVNTTLALMEEGGKLFSAIHERLFRSQRREIRLIYSLIPEMQELEHPNVQILPVTDPRQPNEAHRLARTYAHLSVAQQMPDIHDMNQIARDMHTQLGSDDPDRYLKQKKNNKPPPPLDPISENMSLILGGPVKAYEFQDHDAHIKVLKMGVLNNPNFAESQSTMQGAQAHLMEHLAMRYKVDMEQVMGVKLPPPEEMKPEQQGQITLQAAAASETVLNEDINKSIAESRTMQLVDPVLELEKEKEFNKTKIAALKIAEEARQADMEDRIKRLELALEATIDREKMTSQEKIADMVDKPHAEDR